ncbi:hypothetical protein [Pseudorhodoplanes sp.]|uniref:hypothetical protein n=1 Tax=Pseudorhodoplanes sp. TaxID=1934341 RepID=UPI00391D8673
MALELSHGSAIQGATTSQAIRFLLSKWSALNAAGKLDVKLLTEGSYDIPAHSVYMVALGDDFLYMHFGEKLRQATGKDFTGRLLSSIGDQVAHDLHQVYSATLRFGAPVYVRFTSPLDDRVLLWERLVLPLPAGPSAAILVCYSEVMCHQAEVYEYVFRHSPVPMLTIYPIYTPDAALDDGWVVLINDTARDIFNVRGNVANLRLRELRPFQRADFWAAIAALYPQSDPPGTTSELSPLGDNYRTLLVRMKHLALLRFQPKSLQNPSVV